MVDLVSWLTLRSSPSSIARSHSTAEPSLSASCSLRRSPACTSGQLCPPPPPHPAKEKQECPAVREKLEADHQTRSTARGRRRIEEAEARANICRRLDVSEPGPASTLRGTINQCADISFNKHAPSDAARRCGRCGNVKERRSIKQEEEEVVTGDETTYCISIRRIEPMMGKEWTYLPRGRSSSPPSRRSSSPGGPANINTHYMLGRTCSRTPISRCSRFCTVLTLL